jgi:hypothetical protein
MSTATPGKPLKAGETYNNYFSEERIRPGHKQPPLEED